MFVICSILLLEEYELDEKTVTDTFAKYKAKYSV